MNNSTKIWDKPWKYKEGILISLTLLLTGFVLEYSTRGIGVEHLLLYPKNIYLGIGLILVLLILATLGRKWVIVEWLQSIPTAICSIGLLLTVSLLMGLTLQHDGSASEITRRLGLSHILNSWPYLLSNLFLLLSLGLTTIKNIKSFKVSKIGFIISHLGLWIVLFGANFGAVQIQRLQLELHEGGINNIAVNRITNQEFRLPFAIKLNDFILDEYNPKLAIISHSTSKIVREGGISTISIDSAITGNLFDWEIYVKDYIYSSAKAGNRYHFINELGAAPSALINATDKNGNSVEGWISCGSYNRPFESLKLNNNYSIVMLFPEPREFTSVIEVLEKDKEPQEHNLEVNKPIEVDGWKIYQLSYDTSLARWSDTSVLELIKDPWIKIVYTGIFLMLAGAIYMFWMGTRKKNDSVE